MQNWYAVTTKTGFGEQDKAENNLLSQMFDTFNPKVTIESMVKGKIIRKQEPLFPGYLFVNFDPAVQSASIINNSYGVKKLVTFGNVLLSAQANVIEALIEKFRTSKVVISSASMPKKGDTVQIKTGPLSGIKAIFDEASGEQRSFLIFTMMGRQTTVEVDNKHF